ncbi:MAG: site-specific integrase [Mycobacterium sp.]
MNCLHCNTALPASSRRDRMYCNGKCAALASYYRRKAGLAPPARWQHPALCSDDPIVGAAARRAVQLGQAHDWSRSMTLCVLDGLVTVLDGRHADHRVPLADVRARPHRSVSRPRLAEVLAELGLLDDDATAMTKSWIDQMTSDLGPGFAQPVGHWLMVLFNGDARTRPRAASTVHVYCSNTQRPLQHWAARYDHLREVTRRDVGAVLEPLRGCRRANTLTALRSLFGFAKKRALIFANPTIGLKAPPSDAALLPLTDEQIHALEALATDPACRVIIALAADHAARNGAIRHLKLDDVDLANHRITLAGHRQRCGELTHRALRRWLDHRRTTWPHTDNPHVLVNPKTVHGTAPVNQVFVNRRIQPAGCTIGEIRADRILHEALTATAGPDPLHLALVFGICHNTAARYAKAAEHLLSGQLEHPLAQ